MKTPLIYLANLTHYREGRASTESIPINLGFLAGYLKAYLNQDVRIQLFNLPHKLEAALKEETPDILASSAYIWSFRLNYSFLEETKKEFPEVVTVMGGPNFPGSATHRENFLKEFHGIDFFSFLEGENSFLDLVRKLMENGFNFRDIQEQGIPGFNYLWQNEFRDGGPGVRIRKLDLIPSPYLTGWMDPFLEEGFVPMLQTNRGCPFTCAFCCSGNDYHSKVDQFNLARVLEEIDYISERVKSKSLHITDDNFGIFPRDKEISKKLAETKIEREWPLLVNVSTSKVNKKQVADCIAILGESIEFSASMQSFNDDTLKEIKRKNLSFGEFQQILDDLKGRSVPSVCEVILGMPEETRESHLGGLRQSVDAGIDLVSPYTCMLLWNTPMKESSYYDRFQMQRRFRVIPRDFGLYQNRKVVEVEEVCVGTTRLRYEDYVDLRGFHFVLSNFYNSRVFKELVGYVRGQAISVFDWLLKTHEVLKEAAEPSAAKIYQNFIAETQSELWDTEKELLDHYEQDVNFQKLLDEKAGSNLLFKYQAIFLDHLTEFGNIALEALLRYAPNQNENIVREILQYCLKLRSGLFDLSTEPEYQIFSFDLLAWLRAGGEGAPVSFNNPTELVFLVPSKQKKILKEFFDFYGRNENARGRILTRIAPEMLYRTCDYANSARSMANQS